MLIAQHRSMITDFSPRLYQERIFASITLKNSLVVLPTGLGKTALSMMLAAHRLTLYPESKIVFLAPTKPLVEQHRASYAKHLDINPSKLVVFTGEIPPAKRKILWDVGQIFFSTPQGFENDVIGGKISLKDVSLIVFDEAHHAVGEYAYVYLAKRFMEVSSRARILALTASPGSEIEKIQEVCANLYIEHVEVRTEDDADVKPYIQDRTMRTVSVKLPDSFLRIKNHLQACMKKKLREVKSYGYINSIDVQSKRQLLGIQSDLVKQMTSGSRDFETLKSVSLMAETLKVHHALELLETQGIKPLHDYCSRIINEAPRAKTKAVKNLAIDSDFKAAVILADDLVEKNVVHPKLENLKDVLEKTFAQNQYAKTIVFTQYRDTAQMIRDYVASKNVLPQLFVGQAKKRGTGLSQKKQMEVLDQFRDGLFNTLIATSVAEEGLDIPQVDAVIFYEPIPSAIRAIQRSGRTARHKAGSVIMLIAKGTRDEAYKWSAFHKEKKMHRFLSSLKKNLDLRPQRATLTRFLKEEERIVVFADYREKGSQTMKEIISKGCELKLENLNCADYVLSSNVGVEIKKVADFVDSIIDGRLLLQIKELKKNFANPLVIIEGAEDMFAMRNIHPNAIRGMLATITTSYSIPVLQTRNGKDTAEMLLAIAKREQDENGKDFTYHFEKRNLSDKELQEYIVSALPSVGPSVAKELLKHFGSVEKIMNATDNELKEVAGVGPTIAGRIREILGREYGPN